MNTKSKHYRLNKKLILNKETLRELNAAEMAHAAGGTEQSVGGPSCLIRCLTEKRCMPSQDVTAPICPSQDKIWPCREF
jgi:hypothetical protein